MDYIKISEKIINKLKESDAKKIEALDVSTKTDLFKVLILASVSGTDTAKFIAQDLGNLLKNENVMMEHIDGQFNGKWIVLDFKDIIVHLFQDTIRNKYNIENLWKNRNNSIIKLLN
ncbi:MAG: ribosome silencing factor [Clostridia bacterium]|nr:ribosome silencing factor [Clostridia bacterium]MDD3232151.1 ribosome silencing factor [Clostridia bacterium]MDD3862716.1 ribosome silencing factor [Clostridia bacterium]MDD4408332.1 ribosome silencing factor [Clostridia bacterium]